MSAADAAGAARMPRADLEDDPGYAPERTVLARQRSALALGAWGAVFLRIGTHEGIRLLLIAAGIVLLLAAIAGSLLSQRLTPRGRARAPVVLTILTVGVGALALAGSLTAA